MSTFTLNNLRFLNDIGDVEQFSFNGKNVPTVDGQYNNEEQLNSSSVDGFKNKSKSQDSNSTSSSSIEVEYDENIDFLNELEPSEPSSFRTMDYSENLNDLDHPYLPVYTINTNGNNINHAEIKKNDEFFELDLEKTSFNSRKDRPKSALKRLHTSKSFNQYTDNLRLKSNENIEKNEEKKNKTVKEMNEKQIDEKKTLLNHSFWSSFEQDILINDDSKHNKNKTDELNKDFELKEKELNDLKKNDRKLQNFKVYDISEIGINNSKEKEFFFNDEDSFSKNDEELYDNIDEEQFEKIDEESFDKVEELFDKIEEFDDKIEEESFDKIDEESFEEEQSPSEENLSNKYDEEEIELKNNLLMNTKKNLAKQENNGLNIEKQESQGLNSKNNLNDEFKKDNSFNLNLLNDIKKEFKQSVSENLNLKNLEKQILEVKKLIENKDLENIKFRKKNSIDHDFIKDELSKIEKAYSNNSQKIEKKLENLEFNFKNELNKLNKKNFDYFDDTIELLNKKINKKETFHEVNAIENLINNLKDEIISKKSDEILNFDVFENKFDEINNEINDLKKNEKEIKEIIKAIDEKLSLFISENLHKKTDDQSKNVFLNNENLNKTNINSIEDISISNNSLNLINEKLEQIQNTLKEINCLQSKTKINNLDFDNLTENSNKNNQNELLETDLIKSNYYSLVNNLKLNNSGKENCDVCELAYNVRKNIRLFRSNFLRQKFLMLSSFMDSKTCLENLNSDDKKHTNEFENQIFFQNDDNKLRISLKEAGKNLKEDVKQLKNLGNFDFSNSNNVYLNDNFRLRKIQLLRQEIDNKLRKLNQVIIN